MTFVDKMTEGRFTEEYPVLKAETEPSYKEVQLKEIHEAMKESGLTPELMEKIVKYMQSRLDEAIFPLDIRVVSEEIKLEQCDRVPIIGHPGMILFTFEGKEVAVSRDPKHQIEQ